MRELSGGVKTSFHNSGKSSGHCRSRHIRRTTSSPSLQLALEGSGSMDTARPGSAGPSHTTTGDSGVEDSVVAPQARVGLDSARAVRKRRKSWTEDLPLLHSDRSRQSKVDPNRSPPCNPPITSIGWLFPRCARIISSRRRFPPIQILAIMRTKDVCPRTLRAKVM